VGAGTGILSFFAAQAGAKQVYAVEASEMAEQARLLVHQNHLDHIIKVIRGKIEDVTLPEPIDVIVSEPMGVMLVHERMMESFLAARDRFLSPSLQTGCLSRKQMFPSTGNLWLAPFSDVHLYGDAAQRTAFWNNSNFFGVDLRCLEPSAQEGQFSQVIVGPIDSKTLLGPATPKALDFTQMPIEELVELNLPISLEVQSTGIMHGIAGWFDVSFEGSNQSHTLSTSPFCETTHWYQARFLLSNPLAVNKGQHLVGQMRFQANAQRSHYVVLEVQVKGSDLVRKQRFQMQDQQYWNLTGITTEGVSKEFLGIYDC
jgi:histone-arginine methyltransferase CARM1